MLQIPIFHVNGEDPEAVAQVVEMALAGQVVIRPMMYVALTYDHRIVDGRVAVTFLRRITETIEDPARLLLEV